MKSLFHFRDDDLRNQAWTGFWHREYGNCFTFNKGIDENGKQTDVVTSSQPGLGKLTTFKISLIVCFINIILVIF